MITTTLTLHEHNKRTLRDRIDRLNKKCDKLGIVRPVFTVGACYFKHYETGVVTFESFPHSEVRKVPVFDVTLQYEPIKLGGWVPVAQLTHADGAVKPYDLKAVHEYDYVAAVKRHTCDHCGNTRLQRSYILVNEDGIYKQVGSSCLKDFTGVEPGKYFSLVGALGDIFDSMSEDGPTGGGGWGRGESQVVRAVAEVVTLAKQVIEMDGKYIKSTYEYERAVNRFQEDRKVRNNAGDATGDKVKEVLATRARIGFSAAYPEKIIDLQQYQDTTDKMVQYKYFNQDAPDMPFVTEFTAWVSGLPVKSEFDEKIATVGENVWVPMRDVSFICYVVSTYMKHLELQAMNLRNGHFYNNGEKVTLAVKELRRFGYDSQFGYITVVSYVAEDGRQFKYKGSAAPDVSREEFTGITATVKHGNYQGTDETLLQRIKILKPCVK